MNDDGLESGDDVAREIAMEELGGGRHPSELQHQQIEFLKSQTTLQALQAEKLKAELHHLRAEDGNIAVANVREKLKLVFDVGLAAFGLALIALVVFLIYSAARSQSVVVDAFSVPPDFAASGNTGTVVASGFLDRLQALQRATHSSAQHHHVEDAWSQNVKIAIPEAGISLGQLLSYLRDWLGHDIHVGGSVVQTGDAIVLSVRGSSIPAKNFSGKPADLPRLTTQAAEYVYGQSEPYLYSAYLASSGRDRDAIAFIKSSYGAASEEQRPEMLNTWALSLYDLGDTKGALEKWREELRLNPEAWVAYGNILIAQQVLGDEEGAMQTGEALERATKRGTQFEKTIRPTFYTPIDQAREDLLATHRETVEDMKSSSGVGTKSTGETAIDAGILAGLHDYRAAELELQTVSGSDPVTVAAIAATRGTIRELTGDYRAAYRYYAIADKLAAQSPEVAADEPVSCSLGLMAEMIGRGGETDADIARGGRDVDCYSFKGDVADHRGNWAAAQKDYAAAVALVPSSPDGYYYWGQALMRHHQFQAAIAKFVLSNKKGPHWADPLKRWGDALVWLKRSDLALPKYAEASKYAPNWGGLYAAWGQALDYLGRHSEALDKYRKAKSLDLTGDERWQIRNCCG